MLKSGFSIKGTVTFKVERADGSILKISIENLVVNYGLISLAAVIAGGSSFPVMNYLAMGNSDTPPALGDFSLSNEVIRDLVVVTQLASPADNTVQFQIEHAQGDVVGVFREAGLFDSSGAGTGNMFNRVVFADLDVSLSDTLTVTWLIELKNE